MNSSVQQLDFDSIVLHETQRQQNTKPKRSLAEVRKELTKKRFELFLLTSQCNECEHSGTQHTADWSSACKTCPLQKQMQSVNKKVMQLMHDERLAKHALKNIM